MKSVLDIIPAFAYTRVSTAIQEEKNTKENQERAIAAYAKANNLSIVKWFDDPAMSGNDTDRPQLNEMLDSLDNVKNVIIFDQSRLSRNFEYSLKLMFLFQKLDVKVHLTYENRILDYNDDTMQLITSIQSWAAAQERKMIKARQKAGIQRYKETHGKWGKDKIKLDVRKYKALREAKVSKSAIARIFGISRMTLVRRLKELNLESI